MAFSELLNPGGTLLLTIDLIPGMDSLWNMAQGKLIEDVAQHGDFSSFCTHLRDAGFEIVDEFIERDIPGARVDVGYVKAMRLPGDRR